MIEFVDRYTGLDGIPCPWRACPDCGALGVVPVKDPDIADDPEEEYRAAWEAAEAREPTDDGWHMLTCRTCGGSRRRPWARSLRDIPWRIWKAARFVWRQVIRADGGFSRRVALGCILADFRGPA